MMMNIVLITDEKYALPTRAAIRSAIQNAAGDDPLTVYVVGAELSENTARQFAELGTERATVRVLGQEAKFADIADTSHVSKAALWKFELPNLLPDLERVLYLDSDVIVSGDLRELYATELGDDYVAAVEDFFQTKAGYHNMLGLRNPYFNSGVMLLNLAAMRRDGMTRRLMECKIRQTESNFMDQDAFNVVFNGRARLANPVYNVLLTLRDYPQYEALGGMENWKVLHYSASRKPWQDARVYAAETFMRYLSAEDLRECMPAWLNVTRYSAQSPALKSGMNVVFVTDENYALPTRAAARAALANAAGGEPLTVHVVCDDNVTEATARKFEDLGPSVRVIQTTNRHREELHTIGHYSHAMYLKYELPRLFPELERILFLDGDVIVNGDLRELYATEFGDNYIAAVLDYPGADTARYLNEKLRFDSRLYFNSGVVLMNLAALRRDGMTERLVQFTKQHPWLGLPDQDAFNVVLAGRVKYVSPAYNVLLTQHDQPQYAALGGMANWKVLHYTSNRKPWKVAGVFAAERFLQYISPEDWQICQCAWLGEQFAKLARVEWEVRDFRRHALWEVRDFRHHALKKSRWPWRSWFYEKRVDENGAKRKFKLLGVPLFSIRKQGTRRVFGTLGIRFSWRAGYVLHDQKRNMYYLDQPCIDKKLARLKNWSGVTKNKRQRRLVVSLTSFPQRMYDVHYGLHSLLTQKLKPDHVILWLSPEEFPNREQDVPDSVLDLRRFGLEIRWCRDNLKPYNKLLHALEAFPDGVVVTADDDIYYPADWLKKLYAAHLRQPEFIHCHRVGNIKVDRQGNPLPYNEWRNGAGASALNLLLGYCGVLYPSRALHPDAARRELFQKLCPTTDDLWFWAMAVLNGRQINAIPKGMEQVVYINPARESRQSGEPTLSAKNVVGGGNDQQLNALLSAYPELQDLLRRSDAVEKD